jgi:hypothetical protein
MLAEARAAWHQRDVTQIQFLGHLHQSVRHGLTVVTAILLREERDLEAIHMDLASNG